VTRHGLTYVHSAEPDGFTAADLEAVPESRVELLAGVLLVRPEPTPEERRMLDEVCERLRETRPRHVTVRRGPRDVRIGPATVFRPDLLVTARRGGGGVPLLVVETRPDRGAHYRWREREAKMHGYREAGVDSYWVVDPLRSMVAVYELVYRKRGEFPCDAVCARGWRNGWRLWAESGADAVAAAGAA
jgi:Uma2 family endonuclease